MSLLTLLVSASVVPILVWLGSYIYLAWYYRRWRLSGIRIHESGRYTLSETVLYFNHFLRELFIDTLYTIALFVVYLAVGSDSILTGLDPYFPVLVGLLLMFLGIVVWGSIRKVGGKLTALDLFQYRELDTVTSWGSHWQMHFLSTLAILLIAIFPITVAPPIQHTSLIIAVLIAFFVLSVIFGTGMKAVTDERWLMHGGREILTFVPLGVIPALVPLIGDFLNAGLQITVTGTIVLLMIGALGGYYLWALSRSDVTALAQGNYKPPYLIASHFFEHVLDYIYLVLLMLVLLGLPDG